MRESHLDARDDRFAILRAEPVQRLLVAIDA
jgi:hypothetical protein